MGHKLRSETSKSKAGQGGLVRVALFTNLTLDATCVPVCVILYHVPDRAKGPLKWKSKLVKIYFYLIGVITMSTAVVMTYVVIISLVTGIYGKTMN